MKDYESIFIVRPSVSEEGINQILDKLKKSIEKNGGQVIHAEQWGKRKLAYEIQREKKGSYVLFQIKGDGKVISDLERTYQLEDLVIKSLTIRVESPSQKDLTESVSQGSSGKEGQS